MPKAKGMAVLNYNQMQNFNESGIVPQFFDQESGAQLPEYSMVSSKAQVGGGADYLLFPAIISYDDLMYIYQRIDIAANAVDLVPADVWGAPINVKTITEAGQEEKDSDLAKKIWKLNRDLKVLKTYEEGHRYTRILGLGIVVMGLADGLAISDPIGSTAQELSYLRAYSADDIDKINYYTDPLASTYGEIESYEIKIGGTVNRSNREVQPIEFTVHSSRVVHLNEKTLKKDPWGVGILQAPYDLFVILKNTDWSAGESYFQNASPLFVLSWDDSEDAEPPSGDQLDDAEDDLLQIHATKKYIKPMGWKLEVIQGSGRLPDPGMIWDPVVERIAGAVKIPKQLLLGTSAGALASGETNLGQYYKDIGKVQNNFAEPALVEMYQTLQDLGILPEGDFDIEWAPLWEMTAKEKSEISVNNVNAARVAVGNAAAGEPELMTVGEAREQLLNLNAELGTGRQIMVKQDQEDGPDPKAPQTIETTATGIILDGLGDGGTATLKTLNSAVAAGSMTVAFAKEQFDVFLDNYAEQITKRLLDDIGKNAPEEVQVAIQEGGLPPVSVKILENNLKEMREFGYKQLEDSAKVQA